MANRQAEGSHWRPMRAEDLATVAAISDVVHGRYAEDEATYAERLALYPAGSFVHDQSGTITGFLTTHPWPCDTPPPLNSPLGVIPSDCRSYYLHDLALLPEARGSGAGKAALRLVIDHARTHGFAEITLVAVNDADSFWSAQGFIYEGDSGTTAYGPGTHKMSLPISPTL